MTDLLPEFVIQSRQENENLNEILTYVEKEKDNLTEELKELNGTSVILVPTDQMISLPNAIMALWIYCNNCLLELIGLAQK